MKFIEFILNFFKKEKLEKFSEISGNSIPDLFKLPKQGNVINLSTSKIYVLDENYNLTNTENLKKFLKKDKINWILYQKEKHDCDDFAIKLWAKFKKLYPNFAFGFAISYSHAFNVFIDDKLKIWIVEPQTDKIFRYTSKIQSKYKLRMVLI